MDRAHDVITAFILINVMPLLMVVAAFATGANSPDPVLSGGDRPDLQRRYGSRLFLFRAKDELDRTGLSCFWPVSRNFFIAFAWKACLSSLISCAATAFYSTSGALSASCSATEHRGQGKQ
jgi:hypothetical protein